jgi:hypothetical protein
LAADGRVSAGEVVAPEHGERLVTDHLAGAEHGMAVPQRLTLADEDEARHFGDCSDSGYIRLFASLGQPLLELKRVVEVILDRPFRATRDDDDLFDAGLDCLLDDQLNHRHIDDREHLLWQRLGRRQETGAEPRGRNHRLTNLHG